MTDEQRRAVALEYLKAFDNGGVTSSGGSILDLFAPDAQVYFPKWGIAKGRDQIGKMFGDVGGMLKSITHHFSEFTWIYSGGDLIVCEGTSHGEHADGPWHAGSPEWALADGVACSRSGTVLSGVASSIWIRITPETTSSATHG